jgi:hypothetical protein
MEMASEPSTLNTGASARDWESASLVEMVDRLNPGIYSALLVLQFGLVCHMSLYHLCLLWERVS